ncbi:folate-binding protein YgfZ [Afipia carboxidovorans OM5]|uniref:Folate-binding protein YgfZ n=1 Tax=Afipia carboxidovorans (strain ATCC 49405 / DSM 1227 / KCTC 32145 / OM5) TaxID=504832 RepID=F8BUB7_AFIC5|nr:folate-binding protein YgfZ [Afipia carboxidovorans]AEI02293.1 folate-binding protein YgfZ [Afipia carboxidovorans OM4]AEI05869.1 folate-binding protein YgfZ [Afipia carboxidovorans OM5]
MKSAFLSDRGVIKVGGEDARHFLNGLVTTNIELVRPGLGRFGALLTPQGKIIADFLVTEIPAGHGGGFLLDCPKSLAQPLTARLSIYKLRAKVVIENLSDSLGVLAVWDGQPQMTPDLAFADPRDNELGWRILVPAELAEKAAAAIGATMTSEADYEAHRIACGAPRGGVDFGYNDAFPHDANMDRLHGVDFDKGCYIGQEVVSRMQHRGTARNRIVRVGIDGDVASGTTVMAGEKTVGTFGSSAGGHGLALLRVDRVNDAIESGLAVTAEGHALTFVAPQDIALPKKAVT